MTQRIQRFRATWNLQQHNGLIEVATAPDQKKNFSFTNPAEFAAVYAMLQLDNEVYLLDGDLVSTNHQPTGVRPIT